MFVCRYERSLSHIVDINNRRYPEETPTAPISRITERSAGDLTLDPLDQQMTHMTDMTNMSNMTDIHMTDMTDLTQMH